MQETVTFEQLYEAFKDKTGEDLLYGGDFFTTDDHPLQDSVTLSRDENTCIKYIVEKKNDYKLTKIVADGSNYKPSRSGAGKITYTIFFSNDTRCKLIWTDGEWKDTLTADTKCTPEMKDAIAQYVSLPVPVETYITTNTPSEWHKIIKSTIKRNIKNNLDDLR